MKLKKEPRLIVLISNLTEKQLVHKLRSTLKESHQRETMTQNESSIKLNSLTQQLEQYQQQLRQKEEEIKRLNGSLQEAKQKEIAASEECKQKEMELTEV